FGVDEGVPQQQRLRAEQQQDCPGCPWVEPALCQPIQAQARQQECDEISVMPHVWDIDIWKDSLNDSNEDGGQRDKRRSMTIIGGIVVWLVKNSKERRVGIQGVGCIVLI